MSRDGRLEAHFVGSTDGITWHRYDRTPYATPGPIGSDTANMVFLGTGMAIRGDEIWQYAAGFRSRHGDVAARKKQTDGIIHRYVQRLDGFVSLDFDNDEGRCTTGPVKVSGAQLLLNVDTGALGSLRVGLLDEKGNAIPGFGLDDCEVIRGNSTKLAVTWKGAKGLAELEGKDVQLQLAGRRTKLFSFSMVP